MSASRYSVYLCDPFGVRLGEASNFVKLQYTRVVNDVGALKLWLPADFDTNLIRIPDGRIEVWRRLPGSSREYLDTETVWLIKAAQWDRTDKGDVSLLVEADTPLCLLRDPGRIVAQYDLYISPDTADNMILAFCSKHGITGAVASASGLTSSYPGRAMGQYITAGPSLGLAATPSATNHYMSWKPLLTVCQELAQASTNLGIYCAFDIVAPTPDTLELRTYTQQRGVDHRFPGGQNPVLFGAEMSNVGQATLRLDYRKEITAVWAGGAGNPNIAPGQIVTNPPTYDSTRIGQSPFGWRETYITDSQQTDVTALGVTANAALRGGRPRKTYRGRLLSVPDCSYGVHWNWGDYVTVQDYNQSFDCRIEAVTVTVEKNQEKIDAYARNDT